MEREHRPHDPASPLLGLFLRKTLARAQYKLIKTLFTAAQTMGTTPEAPHQEGTNNHGTVTWWDSTKQADLGDQQGGRLGVRSCLGGKTNLQREPQHDTLFIRVKNN